MNEDVLEQIAHKIVDSIEKYLDKDSYSYDRIFKLASSPKSENDIPDLQWTLIIEQAWQMAFRQAMEDNSLSMEERQDLNKMHGLGMSMKNTPGNRSMLNYKILTTFKHLVDVDKKEEDNQIQNTPKPPQLKYPKPTPWDDNK